MKIELTKGQKLFFTSDTHYNHTNICKGVSNWPEGSNTRDFKNLDEMNAVIVDNINEVVGQDDILIHLGDWSFGGIEQIGLFRERIVCKDIHLVLGNHDHHIKRNKQNTKELFTSVQKGLDLEVKTFSPHDMFPSMKYKFVLSHYPIASWENMKDGVIHLHGHIHLPKHLKLNQGKAMDVGVDGNDYRPYSLSEIVKIMDNQPIAALSLPKDHHERI